MFKLGFHRRGAPERRNLTKSYVVPYQVGTSVFWVVDVQDSLREVSVFTVTSFSLVSFSTYS
jgi:hypothetical protein